VLGDVQHFVLLDTYTALAKWCNLKRTFLWPNGHFSTTTELLVRHTF
jgi:hypothetical protein